MRLLALRAETMQAMRRLKLPCDDITPIGLWGSDMYLIGVNNDQFEVLRLWNVQTEDVTPATLRDLHSDSPAIPTSPSAGNAASGARSSATGAPAASSTPSPASGASSASPAPSDRPARAGMPTAAPARPAAIERDPEHEMPDPSAARGESSLDIQAAFDAVALRPAPSGGSSRRGGAASERQSEPDTAAPPAGGSSASPRRDGPDLKLESSGGSAAGRTQEGRPARVSRADEPKSAPEAAPPAEDAKDGGSNAGKLRMTVDGEHLYAEIKGGKIVLKDRTYDSLAHARDSIRRERNKVAVWEYFDEGVKAWRVLNRD